jgi:nicotinamide mononucleotide transporter
MDFFSTLWHNLQQSTLLEVIAVIAGILSVYFSRKENILVYPVGLINTIFYVYLSFRYHLPGEAVVNFYYTVMSFFGWWQWARRDSARQKIVHIRFEKGGERIYHLLFFFCIFLASFFSIKYLKGIFFEGAIPLPDALASAAAFTGMYLMTRKVVESWYWWILTNIISIPLYYVKGLALTSVYYGVLLVLAIFGLVEWRRKAKELKTLR